MHLFLVTNLYRKQDAKERVAGWGQEAKRRNTEANTLVQSESPALLSKGWSSDASVQATHLWASAGEELWAKVFASMFRRFVSCPSLTPLSVRYRRVEGSGIHQRRLLMNRPIVRPVVFLFFCRYLPLSFFATHVGVSWKGFGWTWFSGKDVAFQIFLCEATFATRTFPENHGPSHPEAPHKIYVALNVFFWCVDLRAKNLPRKPCGVSIFFCESTFATRTNPEIHVAFQVFL